VGFFVVLGFSSSAGVRLLDLFEAFMLDPLVDDIERSCKSRVGAWGENSTPDGEAPAIKREVSIR
jgi:hypothetical protein